MPVLAGDFKLVEKAIRENWWEKRLPYIKESKERIMNKLQVMPYIERLIK